MCIYSIMLVFLSYLFSFFFLRKITRKLPFPMSGFSSRHQTFPTEIYKIKHISTRQQHKNIYDSKIIK